MTMSIPTLADPAELVNDARNVIRSVDRALEACGEYLIALHGKRDKAVIANDVSEVEYLSEEMDKEKDNILWLARVHHEMSKLLNQMGHKTPFTI